MQFLHDVYGGSRFDDILGSPTAQATSAEDGSASPSRRIHLEVGGGPVIDKYISAAQRVDEILHLEPSETCRDEIRKFVNAAPDAFDWSHRFKFVANLHAGEQGGGTQSDIKDLDLPQVLEEQVRRKISHIGPIDLFRDDIPCASQLPAERLSAQGARVTVVSSHSTVECITQNRTDFDNVLSRIVSLCPKNALLVMTVNTETTDWSGGDNQPVIPTFWVTSEELIRALESHGFGRFYSTTHKGSGDVTEMESTFAVAAVRLAVAGGSPSSL